MAGLRHQALILQRLAFTTPQAIPRAWSAREELPKPKGIHTNSVAVAPLVGFFMSDIHTL